MVITSLSISLPLEKLTNLKRLINLLKSPKKGEGQWLLYLQGPPHNDALNA